MPVVFFLLVTWSPGETSTPGIPGQNIAVGLGLPKKEASMLMQNVSSLRLIAIVLFPIEETAKTGFSLFFG